MDRKDALKLLNRHKKKTAAMIVALDKLNRYVHAGTELRDKAAYTNLKNFWDNAPLIFRRIGDAPLEIHHAVPVTGKYVPLIMDMVRDLKEPMRKFNSIDEDEEDKARGKVRSLFVEYGMKLDKLNKHNPFFTPGRSYRDPWEPIQDMSYLVNRPYVEAKYKELNMNDDNIRYDDIAASASDPKTIDQEKLTDIRNFLASMLEMSRALRDYRASIVDYMRWNDMQGMDRSEEAVAESFEDLGDAFNDLTREYKNSAVSFKDIQDIRNDDLEAELLYDDYKKVMLKLKRLMPPGNKKYDPKTELLKVKSAVDEMADLNGQNTLIGKIRETINKPGLFKATLVVLAGLLVAAGIFGAIKGIKSMGGDSAEVRKAAGLAEDTFWQSFKNAIKDAAAGASSDKRQRKAYEKNITKRLNPRVESEIRDWKTRNKKNEQLNAKDKLSLFKYLTKWARKEGMFKQ